MDDFGKGKVETSQDVLATFADVTQTNNSRTRIENTNGQQIAMRFTIRYTEVQFNAVRYKGKEYIANSVVNVNEENRELVIDTQRAE